MAHGLATNRIDQGMPARFASLQHWVAHVGRCQWALCSTPCNQTTRPCLIKNLTAVRAFKGVVMRPNLQILWTTMPADFNRRPSASETTSFRHTNLRLWFPTHSLSTRGES